MVSVRKLRLMGDTSVRLLADVIMVNVAFALAMMVRYLVEIWAAKTGQPREIFLEYLGDFLRSFGFLTAISVIVFYMSGFYTRGRFYQGRYKAFIVGQAVTISYLIFALVLLLSKGAIPLSRSVLLLAWACTSATLIASRLWSALWRNLGEREIIGASRKANKAQTKNVLVIGGAGYIGSALLPKLLDAGYRVRLLDLFLFGKEPISKVIGHPNLDIIHADFRQVDKIVMAVRGMDEVIHLGAIVGDPACSLDEDLTVEVNLMATRMIAEVAKASGIRRFCFASTCSVYGANDHLLDERSELNPISLYAKSKLASEKVLLQLGSDDFSPVILRFGTVYGFSGRTRFDLVVNLLTAKAIVERKITVFGGGQWRPFLHVDDAALALMKALEAPVDIVRNQIFNAGSNEQNYRLEDVAHIIQAFIPEAKIVDMGAGTDFRNYRVDFTRISNLLDFAPQWQLGEGVKQVRAAFESGKIIDYTNPMYSNFKFLSEESNRLIRREKGWAYELINGEARPEQSPVVAVMP